LATVSDLRDVLYLNVEVAGGGEETNEGKFDTNKLFQFGLCTVGEFFQFASDVLDVQAKLVP